MVAQHVEDVAEQDKRARCQSVQVLCVRHLQGFPQKTPAAPRSTHVLTTRQSNHKYFVTLHTWPHCSVLGKRTIVLWCRRRQHGGNESWKQEHIMFQRKVRPRAFCCELGFQVVITYLTGKLWSGFILSKRLYSCRSERDSEAQQYNAAQRKMSSPNVYDNVAL